MRAYQAPRISALQIPDGRLRLTHNQRDWGAGIDPGNEKRRL